MSQSQYGTLWIRAILVARSLHCVQVGVLCFFSAYLLTYVAFSEAIWQRVQRQS